MAWDRMEDSEDRISRYCLRPSTGVNTLTIMEAFLSVLLCNTKLRGARRFLLLQSSWKTQKKDRIPEVSFSLGWLFDLNCLLSKPTRSSQMKAGLYILPSPKNFGALPVSLLGFGGEGTL